MPPRRFLFLTSPEHGQANVHLAVMQTLRDAHGDAVELHLGSNPLLEPRCPPWASFHPIKGRSLKQHFTQNVHELDKMMDVVAHPCGFLGAMKAYRNVPSVLCYLSPAEYLEAARSCEQVISELDPDVVVIDPFLNPAMDAARRLERTTVCLSPNTFVEDVPRDQGAGALLIPAPCTGYPFPVPWHLVPLNVFCVVTCAFRLMFSSHLKAIGAARKEAGYTSDGLIPLMEPRFCPRLDVSCPPVELELICPADVIPCGPITQRVAAPLADTDAELAAWLAERPTVLVVLGSHIALTDKRASELYGALACLLDARPDVQVLWKLMGESTGQTYAKAKESYPDRLKIVDWLDADPIAILQTGNVCCFVNHGGSNSYHEALETGVPQVILASWYDTYDFGQRAEKFGIGVWGNKRSSPYYSAGEFGNALLKVVGQTPQDGPARAMAARAKEVAEIVREYNGGKPGRVVAADFIWTQAVQAA